jgi:hypothetical protein
MNKPLPLHFSDTQLTEIFRLAAPLEPVSRVAFLEDVAAALSQAPQLGDGTVYRICREIQRRHFDPPDFSVAGAPRKWDR